MTLNEQITEFMKPGHSEGWLTAERGIEMAELILEHKPETAVSLGVFAGRSIIALGLALKQNGSGRVYGIDPWKPEDTFEGENDANKEWWKKVDLHLMHKLTMEAIWNYELDDYAVIIRSASQRVPQLFSSIGFLEVDGNHSEIASCRDVDLYLPKVAPGGLVWMDDCDWASTQKAQDMISAQCDLIKSGDNGHYKIFRKRT